MAFENDEVYSILLKRGLESVGVIISRAMKRNGLKWHKIGMFGRKWGRHMPSSGREWDVANSMENQPIWLFFSGVVGQPYGAALGLMKIPAFAATIERAAAALRPLNLDLVWILTEAPESAFEDLINKMVSITAMQVALVDVLRAIGLRPDGIVGLSLGEIGAAYADDALNIEQSILVAYWIARCMVEAKVPLGARALVGLSWEECEKRCPPESDITIKYSQNIVIISGPIPSVKDFVETLSSEGVFVKRVTSGLQFHTKHTEAAAPALRKHLEEIIPNPKRRSTRWISSCLPKDEWDSELGKLCSAEYILNMNEKQVDMVTPLQEMPRNAVLVEVSTYATALTHLKPVLPASVTIIELVSKDAPHPAAQLCDSIRKIYETKGEQLPVERLSEVVCNH